MAVFSLIIIIIFILLLRTYFITAELILHHSPMALRICTLVLVDLRCSSLFSFPKYKFSTILRSAKYLSGLPHVFRARSLSSKPQSKIITIPNILTSLRIAATPLIVSLILHHELASAATLTVVAGLTDVVCIALFSLARSGWWLHSTTISNPAICRGNIFRSPCR